MKSALPFIIMLMLLPVTAIAQERLPGGGIAEATGLRAWYAEPTERYDHGILDDAIEAGSLIAERNGKRYRYDLPEDSVFEDITPRLVDADGDGQLEILTIKSYLDNGSTIALYGIRDGTLVPLAEAMPIGKPHRWLNPAGVADYNGDGSPDIAVIRTPHIGGILILYHWDGSSSKIVELARKSGYSTHAIGSTELNIALTVDWNGDGIMDLLLPRQNRTDIVPVYMVGNAFTEGDTYRMRREITGRLEMMGNFVKVPLRGGLTKTITRPYNPAERAKKKEKAQHLSD
ncbi:MAG: VCBS repeat-containing protein [Alphaproteobacteria bacterium]|nr:VCBS repeat-containing protein [Alphaproteobacteria bacterium]